MGQEFGEVVMTAGVIAFPITFIITDLLNECYGKKASVSSRYSGW